MEDDIHEEEKKEERKWKSKWKVSDGQMVL